MKQATAGIVAAGSIAALAYYQGDVTSALYQVEETDSIRTEYDNHIAEYGKSYGTKEEYEFRLAIFRENFIKIQEHNQKNTDDAVWGVNHMIDWTPQEYKRILGFKNKTESAAPEEFLKEHHRPHHERHHRPHHEGPHHERPHHGHHGHRKLEEAPTSIDWRTEGAVTPVKNQGQCGSCWAFSTTGALEGAYFMANKELKSFSEQQLVDCSSSFGNQGCNGGLMDDAFKYVESHKIELESEYPYTGRDGKCHEEGGVAEIKSFMDVTPKSPTALADALAKGPVSIAVDAGGLAWQFYFGGIMKHFCGTSLDHGVLLVGYGTEGSEDYWIVKNSWGASWGEKGYVRIFRDMEKNDAGVCGLQLQPSQPAF
jgi:C1A family cysteine protease